MAGGEIPHVGPREGIDGKQYAPRDISLRPPPQEKPDNTVKRIVSAILLLSKSNVDVDAFDRELSDQQRAKLHDDGALRKARTFLDSL